MIYRALVIAALFSAASLFGQAVSAPRPPGQNQTACTFTFGRA